MKYLFTLVFVGFSTLVQADNLVKIGEGTARWGWIKLYHAQLFAPPGLVNHQLLQDDIPLRLQLCYHRRLDVDDFVQGANHVLPTDLKPALQAAVDQLHAAYQPVQAGDCYHLDYQPQLGTRLRLNQQELVRVTTPGFKAVYFGIWLGDSPLSTSLKQALTASLPSLPQRHSR